MTAFRRFRAIMELPVLVWEVESARKLAWEAVRQLLYRDIRDQGHRPLDGRMVPAALSESGTVTYQRTPQAPPVGRPVRVPCDESAADTVLLELSTWALPDTDTSDADTGAGHGQ